MIAPIDEKNVCTDWIENLFDDNNAIYESCCYIGFVEQVPTVIRWEYNDCYFDIIPVVRRDIDFMSVKNRLLDLLTEFAEDEQLIGSNLIFEKDKMRIHVYYKNENY